MKKLYYILILTIIYYLTSCVGIGYVGDYYNCSWKSEDPSIEFVVKSKQEKKETNCHNEGFLIVDDNYFEIVSFWTPHGIQIYYKDDVNGDSVNYGDVIISGNYDTYRNKIVVKLDIDKVYNFKYDTITFVRTDL